MTVPQAMRQAMPGAMRQAMPGAMRQAMPHAFPDAMRPKQCTYGRTNVLTYNLNTHRVILTGCLRATRVQDFDKWVIRR